MENQFIKYDQALELKELGFDETCIMAYYHLLSEDKKDKLFMRYNDNKTNSDNAISAPLYQQAFKFFRENHNLLGNVYSNASGWLWEIHDNIGGTHRFGSEYSGDCEESGMFTSFDKAEQSCLIKLIQIIKEKK